MKKKKKQQQPLSKRQQAAQKYAEAQQRRQRQINENLGYGGHDPHQETNLVGDYRGTTAGGMPSVLRGSDAAKLVTCPECDRAAGRHSPTCSRRESA